MRRRDFLKSTAIGAAGLGLPAFFAACGKKKITGPKVEPDFILEGDENAIATIANDKLALMNQLVDNPGKQIRIGVQTDSGIQLLTMEVVKNNAAAYHHLRLEMEGKVANLVWGSKNLFPSIKFVDDRGNQMLEVGLNEAGEGRTPGDWLRLAIKVLAIALVVWLGAKVVGLVIAAIAFLAFYAIVFALIILALAFLKSIADRFGWDLEGVKNFFQMAVQALLDLLREVAKLIGGGGNPLYKNI